MKKTFCDCCGNEMPQGDPLIKAFRGPKPTVTMGNDVTVTVDLSVDPIRRNGEHVDICGNCSWLAIDRIDPRPKAAQEATPNKYYTIVAQVLSTGTGRDLDLIGGFCQAPRQLGEPDSSYRERVKRFL